jgi:hypothetical protein
MCEQRVAHTTYTVDQPLVHRGLIIYGRSIKCSVSVTTHAFLLKNEGLFTQRVATAPDSRLVGQWDVPNGQF